MTAFKVEQVHKNNKEKRTTIIPFGKWVISVVFLIELYEKTPSMEIYLLSL